MNIFVLHSIPSVCAKYHCDKHVVKMILETAQLLCGAVWCSGGEAPYRLTHKNHPCSIWCRESVDNWNWLKKLGLELCKEYTYRYGKIHKSESIIQNLDTPNLPKIGFTRFAQAVPENCKKSSAVVAYRKYYIQEKAYMAKWKKRGAPEWFSRRIK